MVERCHKPKEEDDDKKGKDKRDDGKLGAKVKSGDCRDREDEEIDETRDVLKNGAELLGKLNVREIDGGTQVLEIRKEGLECNNDCPKFAISLGTF